MARKLYEKQAVRRRTGQLANGVALVVYTDEAGTALADVSATSGGSAIAGSTVTTADIAGLGPASLRFWGPTDGTDTLYLRTPDDASLGVQKIEAAPDPRLDALEAGSSGIPGTILDAKGDIIAATAADTASRLAVGANGTVLTAASGQTTGLQWATPSASGIQATIVDAKGDLLAATAADTVARLAAGTDSQMLAADSTATAGVRWTTRDVIDPQEAPYFADGTGATSAKGALEAAFAAGAAQGRAVVSKPGRTYRVDATVWIQAAVQIDFRGSSIKKGGALNDYALYVPADDVTIVNMVIDGTRATCQNSNVKWEGVRGKAIDCWSKSSRLRGWEVIDDGELDAIRCKATDNVTGGGTGIGFSVADGGVLRTFDCEASDNDYVGFLFYSDALAGCRLHGIANRNGLAGAYIEAAEGTVPYLYAEGNNTYGLYATGNSWDAGTLITRDSGAAIAAFSLAFNGSGPGVALIGADDWSIDTIVNRDSGSYAYVIGDGTRNIVGTVVGRRCGDPIVTLATNADHNHVGRIIASESSWALSIGEGAATPGVYNVVGEILADQMSHGVIIFADGNYNHVGKIIARNCATSDTGLASGLVQFGNADANVVHHNTVDWLEYEHDAALASAQPAYLAHATAESHSNRVEGRPSLEPTAGMSLDLNGGNFFSFPPFVTTPKFKAGNWYTRGAAAGTTQWSNGEVSAQPLLVGETTLFDRLAIKVDTAGSVGSVIRLGIYAEAADGTPGALVLDAGTVSGTSTGEPTVTISQRLNPGLYYLVAAWQGAPATQPLLYASNEGDELVSDGTLATQLAGRRNGFYRTGVTGALPTPLATTGTTNTCIIVAIRAA